MTNDDATTVFIKVQRIVQKVTLVELAEILLESTIVDLGADSLDQIEIVMNLEKEFNITIPDSEAEKMVGESLKYVVDYITRN